VLVVEDLTKEALEREYCSNLLTQREIAVKYNTTEDRVRILRKRYKIATIYNRLFLQRRALELTPLQREILLGTLCGDGHIQKGESGSCHFEVSHSVRQLDYLAWKADILRDWIPFKEPYKVIVENYRSNRNPEKKFYRVEFHTIVAPVFNELYEFFYSDGKKTISKAVLDQMTARSLAVWFCDDGGYSTNSLDINGLWSDLSKEAIVKWFNDRWDIKVQIKNYRHSAGTDRIVFSVKESEKLGGVIFPFVVPSMRYKFKYVKIPLSSESIRRAPLKEG